MTKGTSFPNPLNEITLAAGKYTEFKDSFNGIGIYAYFFPEDVNLVKAYLENAKRYLKLYNALICKFPYRRFSIVENFYPTGYSRPTYTLLGQQVVRLPFIPRTSLGHEILHQWFGNLVYVDYQRGNWAEGLTTFFADHLYEEEKGGFTKKEREFMETLARQAVEAYINEDKKIKVDEVPDSLRKKLACFVKLRRKIKKDKLL